MVVPFGEPRYYELRPSIAIPKPDGTANSAIDLNGFFGLHPSLGSLKPMFDARHLAIVDAVGSPDPTRSHFDAQDYMESGTPGYKGAADGWLNRALPVHTGPASPVARGQSWRSGLSRTLRGHNDAVAVRQPERFSGARCQRSRRNLREHVRKLARQVLNGTGRETFNAVKIMQSIQKQSYMPANGAKYPGGGFGQSLQQIARLIKADVGIEVAFADIGGWDTHVNEAGAQLDQGELANIWRNSASRWRRSIRIWATAWKMSRVVTMSEFGRTVKENGDRGTDHGHANVMFVHGRRCPRRQDLRRLAGL